MSAKDSFSDKADKKSESSIAGSITITQKLRRRKTTKRLFCSKQDLEKEARFEEIEKNICITDRSLPNKYSYCMSTEETPQEGKDNLTPSTCLRRVSINIPEPEARQVKDDVVLMD
ncbi:hypothetical protein RRG08_019554 [Elysia crispata]|uniref:Uncharacterized protein n=1 Tax=Elysia crispata TaxID=231223 RepID=A0AAE0YXW0_9GAST|nr:hypothetical protein RRG08_019554 [Elysia crispata]